MTFKKRTHISPSQIKMLMDCPTKWWFAYVKRPPVVKFAWLPFGESYHKALEAYFNAKGKEPFSIAQTQKVFRAEFQKALKRREYSFAGTPGKVEFLRRGQCFVQLYLRKMGHLQPTADGVEKKFNININSLSADGGSFSIKGIIDLIIERGDDRCGCIVIDHKTANSGWLRGKAPSHGWESNGQVAIHWAKRGDRADQEIQSYAYPWAYWRTAGEIPDRFEFHVVHPEGLEIHKIRRTEKDLEWFERLAGAYVKLIQGNVFPPRDNWWGCKPGWCDYWKFCKGKHQRTDF